MAHRKNKDFIKLEYEKAQDSAQHYNQMIWILIPVFLSFVFYIVSNFNDLLNTLPDIFPTTEAKSAFLVMTMSFTLYYLGVLVEGAHIKKVLKYEVCKTIEKNNDFIGQGRLLNNLEKLGYVHEQGIKLTRLVRKVLALLLVAWALKIFVSASAIQNSVLWTVLPLATTVIIAFIEWCCKLPQSEEIRKLVKKQPRD